MAPKRKECGNNCNRMSDVDEGLKRNVIKYLVMKIEKLTTRKEQRDSLKRKLWAQLEKNGYTKKKEEEKDKRRR